MICFLKVGLSAAALTAFPYTANPNRAASAQTREWAHPVSKGTMAAYVRFLIILIKFTCYPWLHVVELPVNPQQQQQQPTTT
jgi:hypothetical protein